MQALRSLKKSLANRSESESFRQRCASALMHSATLGALGVLLVNDLVFKARWPGAWVPGKLSDLAWMVFAPPVLAFILSFATFGRPLAQRTAFLTAYVGLPLLYVAFNTFAHVHDVVLQVLGWFGGDTPRSPLDPTDSIVIPFAMAAAIWVWCRPPLEERSLRTRLALLAATVAALASVASSYGADWGVDNVGRTASGALGINLREGHYESMDGGMTWIMTGGDFVPLEKLQLVELRESEPSGVFAEGRIQITDRAVLSSERVVYSFGHLQSGGNRWMQALDKIEIQERVIATGPRDFFFDGQSGNLVLAMGLQGVIVIAPDGIATEVAVGRYSPTDFSLSNKTRTFFSSMTSGETTVHAGLAALLAFSFAALALANPAVPKGAKWAITLAAGISAFLAISVGVYPHAGGESPGAHSGWDTFRPFAALLSGYGVIPLLILMGGLAFARLSPRQLSAIVGVTVGMLLLIGIGALVLFGMGPFIANFVAVALVGLAALGVWAYRWRGFPTESPAGIGDDG